MERHEEYLFNLGLDGKELHKHPKSGSDYTLESLLIKFKKYLENNEDFESISESVLKYMSKEHHPHCTLIATSTNVQVLEGFKSTGEVYYFIKD
ncbi:hypothetical protein D3C87_485920 [compost metagenome]